MSIHKYSEASKRQTTTLSYSFLASDPPTLAVSLATSQHAALNLIGLDRRGADQLRVARLEAGGRTQRLIYRKRTAVQLNYHHYKDSGAAESFFSPVSAGLASNPSGGQMPASSTARIPVRKAPSKVPAPPMETTRALSPCTRPRFSKSAPTSAP